MKSLRQRRAERELEDRRERSRQLMADAEFALEQGNSNEALRLYEDSKRLDPDASAEAPSPA
jgi:phage shock protein A